MNIDKFLDRNSEKYEAYIKLLDLVNRVDRRWQEEYTWFLTPDEQYFLSELSKQNDIYVKYFAQELELERTVALISKVELDGDFPIDILKITGNFKFEKLTHRDYLGTLLSLGIKREKIGDINVFDDGAEIYVHSDLTDYIIFNLDKIRHTKVQIQKISLNDAREKFQEYQEILINVSSERLDAVIGDVYNISRSQSLKLVKQGNVKVNYITCYEQATKLKPNDIISVKGYGRFIYGNILRNTKSDRLVISIKKYM